MQNKILIIEDDIFFANTYKLHLEKAGYITQIATNGSDALQLVDKFHPDLIILDLILPKINGFILLHFFKKIPVIIVSNLDQSDDVNNCISLKAKLFISKDSIDYPKLVNHINNLLHH